MTEKKDETLEFTTLEDAVKLIDFGDAVEETKQVHPQGIHWDCVYAFGVRPGC